MENIRLSYPINGFSWKDSISQMFGCGAAIYQAKFGIPAHNGLDVRKDRDGKMGYGTPVLAMHDGVVESITYDTPHRTRGNGIYIISHDRTFSTNYWHLSAFECNIGEHVIMGQVIGLMGNSGFSLPTPTKAQPWLGTHVHVGLKLHTITERNIVYGGFVNPTPYLYNKGEKLPMRFDMDLWWMSQNDSVAHLQTILKLEGFAEDFEPNSYYGKKTNRDVIKLQQKYAISPAIGYVGKTTRQFLNEKYATGT